MQEGAPTNTNMDTWIPHVQAAEVQDAKWREKPHTYVEHRHLTQRYAEDVGTRTTSM